MRSKLALMVIVALPASAACTNPPTGSAPKPSLGASTRDFGTDACSSFDPTTCLDCCYQRNTRARVAAKALGKCNATCGTDGTADCFNACQASYAAVCTSSKGACDTYNECDTGCFLGREVASGGGAK